MSRQHPLQIISLKTPWVKKIAKIMLGAWQQSYLWHLKCLLTVLGLLL
jgi:hypothetical protein